MKKKLLSTLLTVWMIANLLSSLTVAYAAGNPYPEWQTFTYNGREYHTITCTYYAWQQVRDQLGIALPSWGNAGTWLDYAQNSGYQVGTEARSNSLAVWRPTASNSWGHVAYVTAVNGSSLTYNEGGSADRRANSTGIYENHTLPDGYTSWPDGFIYLKTQQESTQSGERICNLGDEFYGRIGYNGGWLQVTGVPIKDGDGQGRDVRVTTKSSLSDPTQIWRFLRQGNGSYKIVNMGSNCCLDVQTGVAKDKQNVWTWSIDHGDVPERWFFVSSPGKNGYRLVTAINDQYCIDIPGGGVYEGANAEIYSRNSNSWQFFTITKIQNYDPNPAPKQPESVKVMIPPTASAITNGQKLEGSQITGGMVVNTNGGSVPGSWFWASPGTKPIATGQFEALFVPNDSSKYALTSMKIWVTVNAKIDPCINGHDWQSAGIGYSICMRCGDVLNTGTLVPDGNDGFIVISRMSNSETEPSEAVNPEMTDPGAADSKTSDPEMTPSEMVNPEITSSGVANFKAVDYGITSSETVNPEMSDSEMTNRRAADPGTTPAETINPEAADSEMTNAGTTDSMPNNKNTRSSISGFKNFQQNNVYYSGLFRDVSANAWYADNVAQAYDLSLMKGQATNQFSPENNLTIAEAITLAARVHSIYTYGRENFTTYNEGNWYDPYVDYVRGEGIFTENCDFNLPATRDEFVHILAKALPQEALTEINETSSFADAQRIVHGDDVERLYRAGVIAGIEKSSLTWFMPDKTVTRSEAAAIITRMVRPDIRL